MEPILETIRSRGWFEFSYQGRSYLIQADYMIRSENHDAAAERIDAGCPAAMTAE